MARVVLARKQNLVLDNRALAGANWGDLAAATRTGGQPDPQGGAQACLVNETAVNSEHKIYNSGFAILPTTPTQGGYVCASCYMAPGTRGFGGLYIDSGGSFQLRACWNLTTGANTLLTSTGLEKVQANVWEGPAGPSAGLFRRYQVSAYARVSDPAYFLQIFLSSDGTTISYLGVVGQNIVAYAPGVSFANQAGELTDTTAGRILTSIRNLDKFSH